MKVILFLACLLSVTVYAEKKQFVSVDLLNMPYDFEEFRDAQRIRNIYLSERYGDLGISCLLNNIRFFSVLNELSECRNKMCPFSRGHKLLTQAIDLRSMFEKQFITRIKQKVEVSQSLTISSMHSGELFSEFVIINKLINYGYRDITVNLIDPKYTKFVEVMLNPEKVHCFSLIKEDALIKSDSLATITNRIVQFTRWFQNYGDDLKVKVIVYKNMETYLARCIVSNKVKSDAIALIDPQLGYNEETGLANMARWCLKRAGVLGVLASSVPDQILIEP